MALFESFEVISMKEDENNSTVVVESDPMQINLELVSSFQAGIDDNGDEDLSRTLVNLSGKSLLLDETLLSFTTIMAKLF